MSANHWVYFVEPQGEMACKVGISENPYKRISELQVGNHRRLILIGAFGFQKREDAMEIERHYHGEWCKFTLTGEWLGLDPETLLSCFSEVCKYEGNGEPRLRPFVPVKFMGRGVTKKVRGLPPRTSDNRR